MTNDYKCKSRNTEMTWWGHSSSKSFNRMCGGVGLIFQANWSLLSVQGHPLPVAVFSQNGWWVRRHLSRSNYCAGYFYCLERSVDIRQLNHSYRPTHRSGAVNVPFPAPRLVNLLKWRTHSPTAQGQPTHCTALWTSALAHRLGALTSPLRSGYTWTEGGDQFLHRYKPWSVLPPIHSWNKWTGDYDLGLVPVGPVTGPTGLLF